MTSTRALYEFDEEMGTRAPLCPACLELPKGEVFQCKDGHVACRSCYFKARKCTAKECRRALDFDHPIRNRVFEEMAARVVKLDCPFKSKGCGEKVPSSSSCLQEHRSKCCYNYDKYGEMIAICKLLGHADCDFMANNGNTEVLVDHLVSDHGYIFKKGDRFLMKLDGFDEDVDLKSEERQSWTPIILELPEKQCYLLNVTLLNKDNSLSWFSVFLPFNNFTGDRMKRSLRMEYKFSSGRVDFLEENYFKWNMGQDVINLSDMNKVMTREMSGMFQKSWLKSHFVRDGALFVSCLVIEKPAKTPKADGTAIKKFTCGFFGEPPKLAASADEVCPPSIPSAPIPAPHGAHVPEAGTSKANPKKNPRVSCLDTYPKSHQIFVGNLPDNFKQENHLKKLFSEFGDVAEVMFVNSSPGHVAFVVFEEEKGAKLALECKKNIYLEFKGMKRLLHIEPKRL